MKTVLITGAAGFVGFHATLKLLTSGYHVIGVDSLNEYYDIGLKSSRLEILQNQPNFEFHKLDIAKQDEFHAALSGRKITHILHLAAQAGVRYSLENPNAYIQSNLIGHFNVLEFARHCESLEHMVYASSSSVYGDRENGPFHEDDVVRSPVSLYAATKISGEMLSQSYNSLYNIAQTGLRFFTVYGPWGRPDMAYFIFTDRVFKNEPITLFAPDEMIRDFTYIDDIIQVIPTILDTPPQDGHAIYNLGNSKPNNLMQLVAAVEQGCEKTAQKIVKAKQKGDVTHTFADVRAAHKAFGFHPSTSLNDGISTFVDWYKSYYDVV